MKSVYRIRYWSSETSKVKEKVSLKSTLLIGSDAHCDLVLKDLAGLEARLDFKSGDLENLVTGLQEKISPKELFQVGKFVFQWTTVTIPLNAWQVKCVSGAFILAALLLIVTLRTVGSPEQECLGLAADFSRRIWRGSSPEMKEAMAMRRSAVDALKAGDYRRAQIEIESLNEALRPFDVSETCGPRSTLSRISRDYILAIARDSKVSSSMSDRFLVFQKLWGELIQSDRDFLLPKLIKIVRKHYLAGYRLSESESSASDRMIDEAEAACEILSLSSDCYRPQTSHQKEKEPS